MITNKIENEKRSSVSLIQMVCKAHADLLENLNNDDDNDNRYQHDREIIAVIAVVYGYGTQTAAADKAIAE